MERCISVSTSAEYTLTRIKLLRTMKKMMVVKIAGVADDPVVQGHPSTVTMLKTTRSKPPQWTGSPEPLITTKMRHDMT